MDPVRIGKAIRALRFQSGLTQRDLATRLNVTDKAVSKWERGLSVPDISIVTRLSLALDVDVDSLLEGNVTYLERTWQGLLVLKEVPGVFCGSEVYGKPVVYFYLAYFMLAGVRRVCITCSDHDREWLRSRIGNGIRYGMEITLQDDSQGVSPAEGDTMVVYHNPFVYGPNLTRYFQRAMSRRDGVSVLTLSKGGDGAEPEISFNSRREVYTGSATGAPRQCVPIAFFPREFVGQICMIDDITSIKPLYAEPMGNGMVAYSIRNRDSLWETSSFVRFLDKRMGLDIYDLSEIAANRGLIDKPEPNP